MQISLSEPLRPVALNRVAPLIFLQPMLFLGSATTQNRVVKFDGEICGGVLVENASDDLPSKRSSKISFQTSPEVRYQFRRKLRRLHSGNHWCLFFVWNERFPHFHLERPVLQDAESWPTGLMLSGTRRYRYQTSALPSDNEHKPFLHELFNTAQDILARFPLCVVDSQLP